MKPKAPSAAQATHEAQAPAVSIDASWFALTQHWDLVIADLSLHHGINLWDPAIGSWPFPAIAIPIFSLLDEPTRLRAVLTRR